MGALQTLSRMMVGDALVCGPEDVLLASFRLLLRSFWAKTNKPNNPLFSRSIEREVLCVLEILRQNFFWQWGSSWRGFYQDKQLLLPHPNPSQLHSLSLLGATDVTTRVPWKVAQFGEQKLMKWHSVIIVCWVEIETLDSGPCLPKSLQSLRKMDTYTRGTSYGQSTKWRLSSCPDINSGPVRPWVSKWLSDFGFSSIKW